MFGGIIWMFGAMMKFWIDVEDSSSSGNKLGAGPITTAVAWHQTRKMDKAGEFSFSMPAGDAKAALIVARRIVKCYTLVDGSLTQVGAGIIDKVSVDVTADPTMLMISGGDLFLELATRSVGFLELNNVTFASAVSSIMAFAPAGWTSTILTPPSDNVYASFAGESVLAAMIKICGTITGGMHFFLPLPASRNIRFSSATASSGVRAVRRTTAIDAPEVCVIRSLEKTSESYDLLTRIYPFGAGNGTNRLTLEYTTKTAPAGYTLDAVNNYLKNDAAETSYGQIEKYLSFKNIAPISNSLTNLQYAADALFVEAYNQLRLAATPYLKYRLTVSALESGLVPTMTIRVVWNEFVDGYQSVAIDADLIILEMDTVIDAGGMRTTGLSVATMDTYPRDDFEAIVSQIAEGRVMEAHPQLTATKDRVGPYILRMDATHNAQFRFDVGNETTALNYAKLRLKLSPLRASVKSVAGSSTTTASGGGSSPTSSNGGGGTRTSVSDDVAHSHDTQIYDTSSSSGLSPVYVQSSSNLLRVVGLGSNTGFSVDTKSVPHTHDVVIPDHNHLTVIAPHSHTLTPVISTTYGIYQDSQYPSGLTIWIDGTDRTTAMTGSATIAGGSGIELTYDITSYLESQSALRGMHSIEFRCTGGQGEIESEVVMLMTVQAIAVV